MEREGVLVICVQRGVAYEVKIYKCFFAWLFVYTRIFSSNKIRYLEAYLGCCQEQITSTYAEILGSQLIELDSSSRSVNLFYSLK